MFITKGEFRSGVAYEFDSVTLETTVSAAPLQFGDDFIGGGHSAGIPAAGSPVAGYPWVKKIVGSPTGVALIASGPGGQVSCALAATSEAEEASLYWNDSLSIDVSSIKDGMAEWRAALTTLPTGVAQAALGMGSAWVGTPLTLSRYALFYWSASGTLLIRFNDGNSSTYSAAANFIGSTAGITSDTNFHLFRIDWSNPADVVFYYDGNRVNPVGSAVWTATAGANSIMQPWSTVYKASGTGLATLALDKIDVFNSR